MTMLTNNVRKSRLARISHNTSAAKAYIAYIQNFNLSRELNVSFCWTAESFAHLRQTIEFRQSKLFHYKVCEKTGLAGTK
jgi:hypothetical protein